MTRNILSRLGAFVTGSRIYGQPTEESDLDLVVFMPRDQAEKIAKEFPDSLQSKIHPKGTSAVFKFGPLNLIAVWNEDRLHAWQDGTEGCIDAMVDRRRGLTREEAIEVHAAARERHCLNPDYE